MRVLHVHSGNLYGGVETFLATLARASAATSDMTSEFALCFDGRLAAELTASGQPPHWLGRTKLSRPHTLRRARRVLRHLLDRRPYDVVVCHQPWTVVAFAAPVRACRLPLVLWMHMATDGRHWLERLARRVPSDLVIANSRFTADRVSAWLGPTRVVSVSYPVSPPRIAAPVPRQVVRASLATPREDVVVVQVSRLEPMKGHRVLLEALAGLRNLQGWTCWVVGGAQQPAEVRYRRELEAMASRLGVADRLRFLGDRHDVPDLLAAADVFCQPNVEPEGFGLSCVEALRAGVPVVSSNLGGVREFVDEACGVLVPPGDVQQLEAVLRRLMLDPALRARLGKRASQVPAEVCDPQTQLRRIGDVLSRVVARPAA